MSNKASFRPIRPALPASSSSSGANTGPDTASAGTSSAEARKPGTRKIVAQACGECRKTKTKCDAQRPTCGTCLAKGRPCGYQDEEGHWKTRLASTKTRLQSFEKLVSALRSRPQHDADRLLQRIRTGGDDDDLLAAMERESPSGDAPGDEPDVEQQLPELDSRSADRLDTPGLRGAAVADAEEGSRGADVRVASPSADRPARQRSLSRSSGPPPAASRRRSFDIVRFLLPEPSITERAVDQFFGCSGKLFHVFSREQVAGCYRGAFDRNNNPVESAKADLSCLMAVAAVGAQYVSGAFPKDVEDGFYDIARHFFEAVIEHRPLDSIKVCALLGMYNILGKATVSLAYVEVGLGIARRHGLGTGAPRPANLSFAEWVDYKRTWRTLTFFSSWLCSTLGFIPGYDLVCDKSPLWEDMSGETEPDISEVVQTEMSKLCLLKADILRMHLAFKDLTTLAIKSISRDLQSWYQNLPSAMRLDYVRREDLALETKWSILHVHLLYLGAIMLLYRRIASQYLRACRVDRERDICPLPVGEDIAEHSAEAVVAAGMSARILKLLLEEDGVFKRCWLVTFQAYTSAVILLHAAAQKQIHGFGASAREENLERTQDCLAVLAFCGSVDQVASRFHDRLSDLKETLLSHEQDSPAHGEGVTSGGKQIETEADSAPDSVHSHRRDGPDHGYLLTLPQDAPEPLLRLSRSLLVMLCQPFGDPSNKASAEPNVKEPAVWGSDPTRYEYPQMIQHLEWDFESKVPFQWDIGGLDLPRVGGAATVAFAAPASEQSGLGHGPAWNVALGSDRPSGWSAGERADRGKGVDWSHSDVDRESGSPTRARGG